MKLSSIHKTLILIAFNVFILNTSFSQCFEIESILVDACGNPEGENEMVRFKVGATPLNTSNINVNWATINTWLGLCQNGASANATAALNNTVLGCGILLEPTNGVLPANATVILLTSTNVNAAFNSFANLNDTIYVIFQCAGNTLGHFSNGSGTGQRTLSISFSTPAGCNDNVTYDKGPLDNSNGASVSFDPSGNPTYFNNGCQAPISPVEINAINLSLLTICPGDSINLTSIIVGGIQSVFWSGESGNFNNPNNTTTTYYSSINDVTPYYLIIGGINTCNDTIYDSLLVNLNPPNNVSITEADTTTLCQGESVTLHATGSNPFLWNTGATTDSIIVNSAGDYSVSASGNCPSNIDSVTINILPQLTVSITEPDVIDLCSGNTVTLNATGSPSFLWSTGQIGNSITVNTEGSYSVTSNESCPSNSDSSQINIITQPSLNITNPDTVELCQGQSSTLNATSSASLIWNTGESTNSITINTQGTYFVTSSNNCFSISDTAIAVLMPQLNVTISEPDTTFCDGESITLNVNGANSYNWNNGSTSNSIIVNSSGNYSVTANSNCPSNTATVSIIVSPQVTISILEGNTIKICPNEGATLNASTSNNYNWNTGETTNSIQINAVGNYYVETTNGNCPSGYDTITVITETSPIAVIIGDSTICDENETILNANGYGNFTWSNGDEGSAAQIETEGIITLTATNSCNESVSDSREIIKIDCSSTLYIPNSFTPNGDNVNDVFKVEGTNIQSINGKIFNRWGELLYEWNNMSASWNGTFKGKTVVAGTYIYKVKVEFLGEIFETYTGQLQLLK